MQVYAFNPHLIHLFVTTFLTLFLKVFNLQGKDTSKSAGNWLQFMMVLYFPPVPLQPQFWALAASIELSISFRLLDLGQSAGLLGPVISSSQGF
jgi:hypothetical protein